MLDKILKNKPLLYLLIIVALLTVSLIVALTQRREQTTNPPAQSGEKSTQISTSTILDEQIYYPSLFQNNLYYLNSSGTEIRKRDLQTKVETKLLDLNLYFVEKINYSPDHQKAIILEKGAKNEKAYYVAEFSTSQVRKLNPNIYDVSWSPDSENIAYLYIDKDKNFLSSRNYKEDKWQDLIQVDFSQVRLRWQDKNNLLFLPLSSEKWEGTEINQLNIESKKVTKIPGGQKVVDFELLPNGQIIAEGSESEIYLFATDQSKKITTDQSLRELLISDQYFAFQRPVKNTFKWTFAIYDLVGKKVRNLEIEGDKEAILEPTILLDDQNTIYYGTARAYYKTDLID